LFTLSSLDLARDRSEHPTSPYRVGRKRRL